MPQCSDHNWLHYVRQTSHEKKRGALMPVAALNTRFQALRVIWAPVQKLPSNANTEQSACMIKRVPLNSHPAPTRLRLSS